MFVISKIAPLRLLIASLWVGSLWAIGGIAAPTLFAMGLDSKQAGMIAGRLFRMQAWWSIAAALLLWLLMTKIDDRLLQHGAKARWLIGIMLVMTLMIQFGMRPLVAGLSDVMANVKTAFAIGHGAASGLYLVECLLGLGLLLQLRSLDYAEQSHQHSIAKR